MTKFLKKLKLQCHWKIVQNVRFTLIMTKFLKTVKLTVPLQNCGKRSF